MESISRDKMIDVRVKLWRELAMDCFVELTHDQLLYAANRVMGYSIDEIEKAMNFYPLQDYQRMPNVANVISIMNEAREREEVLND